MNKPKVLHVKVTDETYEAITIAAQADRRPRHEWVTLTLEREALRVRGSAEPARPEPSKQPEQAKRPTHTQPNVQNEPKDDLPPGW